MTELPIERGMRPIHPGEILRDELPSSECRRAPSRVRWAFRVMQMLNEQRGISADTAPRPFGSSQSGVELIITTEPCIRPKVPLNSKPWR